MESKLVERLTGTARTVTPLVAVTASTLNPDETNSRHVRAQVAARLPDGTFRVVIDGKSLKLALPPDIKPGDTVQLRVIASEAGIPGQSGTGRNPAGSGLSGAGQLIGALLGEAPGAPPRQTQPILSLPPGAPGELPEPLALAVERSGVFYESHQARWVNGDYPLERLLQEPQAGMSTARQTAADGEQTAPSPVGLAAPQDDPSTQQQAHKGAGIVTGEQRDDAARPELAAREALPIIRQQLDALDTRQIAWLGEIWPGQPIHWEIAEENASASGEDEARDWSTRFVLTLPLLGEVGAELVLRGSSVRLTLSARDADTARAMQAAAVQLVHALEAAGVESTGLTVRCGEPSV